MSKTPVNKKTFKVDVDGTELELAVQRPDLVKQERGRLIYSREFCRLVKPEDGKRGAIVRGALEGVMREQGLWDDSKQKKWEELNKKLLEGEKTLAEGRIKLSKAREVAIGMRRDRYELTRLLSDRNSLDANTAEAQAENARFNYLVSVCTVYGDTGKAYFKSEEDYLNQAATEVGNQAAILFSQLYFNLDENFEKNLPENRFLLKYRLCRDKDLHLIDVDGNLIDAENRRVDEKGRYINGLGEITDADGNLLTEEGDYKVDFVEFEDDIHASSVEDSAPIGEEVAA